MRFCDVITTPPPLKVLSHSEIEIITVCNIWLMNRSSFLWKYKDLADELSREKRDIRNYSTNSWPDVSCLWNNSHHSQSCTFVHFLIFRNRGTIQFKFRRAKERTGKFNMSAWQTWRLEVFMQIEIHHHICSGPPTSPTSIWGDSIKIDTNQSDLTSVSALHTMM